MSDLTPTYCAIARMSHAQLVDLNISLTRILEHQKIWVGYWREDIQSDRLPTDKSLSKSLSKISEALGIIEGAALMAAVQ